MIFLSWIIYSSIYSSISNALFCLEPMEVVVTADSSYSEVNSYNIMQHMIFPDPIGKIKLTAHLKKDDKQIDYIKIDMNLYSIKINRDKLNQFRDPDLKTIKLYYENKLNKKDIKLQIRFIFNELIDSENGNSIIKANHVMKERYINYFYPMAIIDIQNRTVNSNIVQYSDEKCRIRMLTLH